MLVWERFVEEYEKTGELLVDLGSDQTSCHDPYAGGYYPAGLSYHEAQEVGFSFEIFPDDEQLTKRLFYGSCWPLMRNASANSSARVCGAK